MMPFLFIGKEAVRYERQSSVQQEVLKTLRGTNSGAWYDTWLIANKLACRSILNHDFVFYLRFRLRLFFVFSPFKIAFALYCSSTPAGQSMLQSSSTLPRACGSSSTMTEIQRHDGTIRQGDPAILAQDIEFSLPEANNGRFSSRITYMLITFFTNDSASLQGNLTCPFIFLAVGRDYQGGIGIVATFAVVDLTVIEGSCL